MNDKTRFALYLALGLTGLAMVGYLVNLMVGLNPNRRVLENYLLIGVPAFLLLVASCVNFYTAYAFAFGVVDEVVGTKNCARIMRNGAARTITARLKLIRFLDSDNASLPDSIKRVIFIADGLPWVCSVEKFQVDRKK